MEDVPSLTFEVKSEPERHEVVATVEGLKRAREFTYEDLEKWAAIKQQSGQIEVCAVTQGLCALRCLLKVLEATEPKTLGYVFDNLDALVTRYLTIRPKARSGTGQAYRVRSNKLLVNYFAFHSNPTRWSWTGRKGSAATRRRVAALAEVEGLPKLEDASEAPATEGACDSSERGGPAPVNDDANRVVVRGAEAMRAAFASSYALRDGSAFRYALPETGVTVADVQRIAWHLATLANDFSPGEARKVLVA